MNNILHPVGVKMIKKTNDKFKNQMWEKIIKKKERKKPYIKASDS